MSVTIRNILRRHAAGKRISKTQIQSLIHDGYLATKSEETYLTRKGIDLITEKETP